MIFRIIRRLKEQQVAVIYISHYLNEVFEISDRIAVLRDGRNAGNFDTAIGVARRGAGGDARPVADELYDFKGAGETGEEVLTASG